MGKGITDGELLAKKRKMARPMAAKQKALFSLKPHQSIFGIIRLPSPQDTYLRKGTIEPNRYAQPELRLNNFKIRKQGTPLGGTPAFEKELELQELEQQIVAERRVEH